MKKFKMIGNQFLKRPFLIGAFILTFTLIPFLIVDLWIKPNIDTFNVEFKASNEIVEYKELISYSSLEKTKQLIIEIRQEAINKGEKAPYSDFSYVDIDGLANGGISISLNYDTYLLSVKEKYFTSLAQARRFLQTIVKNSDYTQNTNITFFDPICYANELNPYLILGISLTLSCFLTVVFILLINRFKPKLLEDNINYDNKNIYRTPFHLSFYKSALKELKTIKKLVLLAILFAIQLISTLITIPSGFSNLGVSIGYLIFATISTLYGPFIGLIIGFFSDILSFFIQPSGVFFFGYTLSAMLAGLTYGMTLYKTKITFTKCLFTRVIVNLVINSLIGSYWWWIISSKSFNILDYILFIALPKNLVYLLPQSIMMYILFRVLARVFKYSGILNQDICDNINLI